MCVRPAQSLFSKAKRSWSLFCQRWWCKLARVVNQEYEREQTNEIAQKMAERPAGDFLKVLAFPWKLGCKLFIIVAWRFASTKLSYAPETEHDYDFKDNQHSPYVCMRKHSMGRSRFSLLWRRLTHVNWIFAGAERDGCFVVTAGIPFVAFWPQYCARSVVKAKIPLAVAWNNTRGDTLRSTNARRRLPTYILLAMRVFAPEPRNVC